MRMLEECFSEMILLANDPQNNRQVDQLHCSEHTWCSGASAHLNSFALFTGAFGCMLLDQ